MNTLRNSEVVIHEKTPDSVIVKNDTSIIFIADNTPENMANAILIASSSELLENLREIMQWGRFKDGKFFFETSEEQANEFNRLLRKNS
jgi:hypothetical protein